MSNRLTEHPAIQRPLGSFSFLFPTPEQHAQHGFSCIQWDPSKEAMRDDAVAKEEIAAYKEQGLEIVTLYGYRNIVAPDLTYKQAALDDIKRLFQIASFVGEGVGVATETGTKNTKSQWIFHSDNLLAETWQELIKTVQELLNVAEDFGVKLLLEGYVENVMRTADDIIRLRESIHSRALGFVMDPFNLMLEEKVSVQKAEQVRIFEAMADLCPIAHAKDLLYTDGVVSTPHSGSGVFDFVTYFQLLDKYLPNTPLIVEHLTAEQLPEVMNFLAKSYQESLKQEKL